MEFRYEPGSWNEDPQKQAPSVHEERFLDPLWGIEGDPLRFQRDDVHPGQFWVDRGLDGKLDTIEPCEMCSAFLEVKAEQSDGWVGGSLCSPCGARLEIESAIADVRDERPLLLDNPNESRAVMPNLPYLNLPEQDTAEDHYLEPLNLGLWGRRDVW